MTVPPVPPLVDRFAVYQILVVSLALLAAMCGGVGCSDLARRLPTSPSVVQPTAPLSIPGPVDRTSPTLRPHLPHRTGQ